MQSNKPRQPHAGCGAQGKQTGKPCRHPAGFRTDHPGEGRCYLHGGATPPKTHGRYSKITRTRIKDLIEEFAADENPSDLLPELHLLRALVVDYVERYDELTDALIAWHESWKQGENEGKPRQVIDIISVGKFIGEIGSLADRIQKQRQEGAISMATFDRVTDSMGEEVVKAAQEVISDAATRTALIQSIEARWGSIRLDPVKSRGSGPS